MINYLKTVIMKNEMPGIFVPDEVISKYHPDMTREEAETVARSISLSVIRQLKDVADGYYFMTPFNRVSLICDIIEQMEVLS